VAICLGFTHIAHAGRAAVLEFTGDGAIDDEGLAYLADRARGAALDTLDPGVWTIISRENMTVLLDANASDLADCELGECEVDVGRSIGADLVVAGRVVRFGSKYRITLKAFETAEGRLLSTEEVDADDLDALADGLDGACSRLLDEEHTAQARRATIAYSGSGAVDYGWELDRGEHIVNEVTDETGILRIDTDPPEALIYVNDEELGQGSVQKELMSGRYVVIAELGSLYYPAREEVQLGNGVVRITLELQPATGAVALTSEPEGAQVWLDGENVGRTPFEDERKRSGSYQLRLTMADYLSHSETLAVIDGEVTERHVALAPNFGGLDVRSQPAGARIEIDGEDTGEITPHVFERVGAGIAEVALTLEGYGEAVVHPTVERLETALVDVELQAKLGMLTVLATNRDGTPCDGPVFVDGEERGRAPVKIEVLAVRHEVAVECEGERATKHVDVEHNQAVSVELATTGPIIDRWEPDPAQQPEPTTLRRPTRSTRVASARLVKKRRISGGVMTGVGAAAAAVGFILNVSWWQTYCGGPNCEGSPFTDDSDDSFNEANYNYARNWSHAGLGIGIVGSAAGVAGLIVMLAPPMREGSVQLLPGPVTRIGFSF